MRTTRLAALPAVLLLSAGALTACGGGGGSDDLCDSIKDQQADTSDDPSLDELADSFDKVADAAPDEIKDDVETIQEAFADPASADLDAINKAATNVQDYVEENCDGIDLGDIPGT